MLLSLGSKTLKENVWREMITKDPTYKSFSTKIL
jgi:hypothetical protein